ncbi:peptide chain release factor N(5)-glutamine methyltransferase [Candidatus Sumerlaeota bacterium]|nr:peptide chain release factor N(5)-glutamine methyltransferase [Candidatus Sumerlaeota bacterium]
MGTRDRSREVVKKDVLTIGDAVLKSAEYLKGKGIDSPRLDAELLLGKIMNTDRLHLYMDWQKPLTQLEISAYREFIRRRGHDREPVARIIARKNFFKRDFEVGVDTFVPRPETEGVVEHALMLLDSEPALKGDRQTVFEVGTGTGCIIVSLAAERGQHHHIATDISAGALATAKRNARTHQVEGRIDFRHGSVFAGYEGTLGLIVSNPPYIQRSEIESLPPEVRVFDPMTALEGGEDGLDVVRAIAEGGARLLIAGGWTVLEIGEGQAQPTVQIFRATGAFGNARVERDLAGVERYVLVQRNGGEA